MMQRWSSTERRSLPRIVEWQGRTWTREQVWCLLAAMSDDEEVRRQGEDLTAKLRWPKVLP